MKPLYTIPKLLFYTIVFAILCIGCQKEQILREPIAEKEQESSINNVEWLDYNPYNSSYVEIADIPEIKEYLISKSNKSIFDRNKSKNKYLIRENKIAQTISKEGNTTYSFQFYDILEESNTIYNLIVEKPKNGAYKQPFIIGFSPDENRFDEFLNPTVPGGMDFSKFYGNMTIHPFEHFFPNGEYFKSDCVGYAPNGDPIDCEIVAIEAGSSSGGTGTGQSGTNSESWDPYTGWSGSYTLEVYHQTPEDGTYRWSSGSTCEHPGDCLIIIQRSTNHAQKVTRKNCEECTVFSSSGFQINYHSSVLELENILNISETEKILMNERPKFPYYVEYYLDDNNNSLTAKDLANDLIDDFAGPQEIANTAMMPVKTYYLDILSGPYNTNFYNQIDKLVELNLIDPATASAWMANFTAYCAVLKIDNPGWSDTRVFWEASREVVHILLDAGGLVPVIGEVCDISNGIIYTIEGDGINATLSYSAAIPVVGWWASGSKYAKELLTLGNGSKTTLQWVVKSNNVISFGNRNQLARVLGTAGSGNHAHHIIPWEFRELPIVQKAAKSTDAFHMNRSINGIPLSSSGHLVGHTSYSAEVQNILNNIYSSSMNNADAYNSLTSFTSYLKNLIQNNPNKNLGEIADLISYP